jgi:hypothetical protein
MDADVFANGYTTDLVRSEYLCGLAQHKRAHLRTAREWRIDTTSQSIESDADHWDLENTSLSVFACGSI